MNFEISKEYIDALHEIIASQEVDKAKQMLNELHAVDIAEIYNHLTIDEAKFLYLLLDGEKAADVLSELEDDDRERFLQVLPSNVIANKFIDHMASDDAADVLADLPDGKKDEVISLITDVQQAGDIVDLMTYDEDTAGGLMAKELIAVNENDTVMNCLKEIAFQAEEVGEIYYVYVVNNEKILKGIVSLKKLLLANTQTPIINLCNNDVLSVTPDYSSEEVAHLMDKYNLVALPVVDNAGKLIGRITIDDVVDVIKEEADKDYQMLSGLTEEIEPSDSIWVSTRARIPWLLIGLTGGLLGAKVIGFYEGSIAANASIAFFIPLIAGMAGNVGVQSSAIVVQGLANQSIGLDSTFYRILKEFSVASINGIVCSALVFLYNLFFSETFALTIAVSLALFIVILFASIFGTFVPLALHRIKIDPALATGPFITTVNDILGMFIYLSIVSLIFKMHF